MHGQNDSARRLVQHGADVNARDSNDVSPLMYAIGTHNSEMLALLVRKDADLEALSVQTKMTPLILAVEIGDTDAMMILLKNGLNINRTNHEGYTPLMAAAESGRARVVEVLLDRGAEPEAKDYKGKTALMLAQKNGHTEVVQAQQNAETVDFFQ